MKNLKKMAIALGVIAPVMAFSQTAPQGNPPASNTNARAAAAWYRGGNNPTSPDNIFGTMWNSPIYTHTNGVNRMIVNGDKTPVLNGFNVNTSGYVGIGNPNYSPLVGGGPIWSTQGPFSLLHLNGDGGGQENGYRPWMQTGITFTEGFDLSYVGNRVVDGVGDRNEFTMAWSNDPTSTQFGPDDMVFRFLSGRAPGAAGSTINTNFSVPNDLDGRHIARFTGNGELGLGNTFGLVQSGVGYVRPQSLLHMSLFQFDQVWMQITNQLGTGQTIDDGLRFGINGGGNSLAYLNWQENTPFVIQTDWDATPGGINNSERMRISSIGSNGVPKPANFIDDNVTRVAISHRGNTPITAPRSLLHLGYNTGNGAIGNFIADGWRDWMDIGTFTNNGTDNIYVGLKEEGVDRFDAVINWGDNQVAGNTPNGPDNLRFIFTSTNTALPPGEGDPVSQSNNGLETARFVPTKASTLPNSNYGMLGIGDWTTAFNIIPANVIDAKLDIDGDLRIRTVTQDNTLTQILAIDPTDHNRVHWIDGSNLGSNITADNGLSINPANNVQLGNDVGLTTAQLLNDREIPMNGNNIMFNDAANSSAALTIGHPLGTANPIIGKFEVINDSYRIGGLVSSVGNDPISQIGFFSQALHTGASGNATAINANCLGATGLGIGIGVNSISRGATSEFNIAFNGDAANGNFHSIVANLDVNGSSSPRNYGIQVEVINGTNPTAVNYGTQVLMNSPGSVNYGYYSSVVGASTNWAGFFNGNVFVSGTVVNTSDANLKTNVESLDNAMDVINQLNPVSFDFDNSIKPRLNLQQGKQYGLIAQEVETILPEMVGSTTLPAEYDSLGNEIDASFDFKTLDYEKFVPILIAGMKEQQNNLNTKDSLINNLESRLTYLESCIRNANICEEGNRTINQNPATETNYRSVELTNNNSIILDQNSPNPFAENTIINYNIPTDVMEAKLMFYDLNGRIIKELIIEERGESKLTVYGNNLKTGVYTYSLIADGELIATKKMVKK